MRNLSPENQDSEYILVDKDSELRCPNCRKLLGIGVAYAMEIKCPRCRELCRFKTLGLSYD